MYKARPSHPERTRQHDSPYRPRAGRVSPVSPAKPRQRWRSPVPLPLALLTPFLSPSLTTRCLHHWPLLTHLEYDQLGLDLPIYNTPLGLPPPLASLTLPSLLHTLAIQSIHTDSATLLFASLVRASSATLTHVILANAHIEPGDELAPILLPAAASLTTIEYHLIQRTPFSLAAALRALPRLKHLIVPVDILRTKVVLAALTAKAADPAHAWLESVTLGPEEYPAINARAPKVMPARRLRLLELAKVVPTGKVRIGSETIKGADGFADELGRRGIELEVVEQSEIGRDREGRRDRWVWH